MPEEKDLIPVTPTVAGKAIAGTNLGANVGTFAMLAYYMFQGLPSVEQRHTEALAEMKASHKESMAAANTTMVEMNRTMGLMRDEMRDARHDLTELRRVAAPSSFRPVESKAPPLAK